MATNLYLDLINKNDYIGVENLIRNQLCDPSMNDDEAIAYAAYMGRVQIIRLLMNDARVDVNANNQEAFRLALSKQNKSVIKVFLRDARFRPNLAPFDRVSQMIFDSLSTSFRLMIDDGRLDVCTTDNWAYRFVRCPKIEDMLVNDVRVRSSLSTSHIREKHLWAFAWRKDVREKIKRREFVVRERLFAEISGALPRKTLKLKPKVGVATRSLA